MKKLLICTLGLLFMANVASASSIWLQAPGGGTDITIAAPGATAIVEVWFEFDGPKAMASQGDGYGNALMASVSWFMRANAPGVSGDEHFNYWTANDQAWDQLSPPQTGYGGTLADPFTGGMSAYAFASGNPRDAPEMTDGTSIDAYQMILQAAPGYADGFAPDTGWIAGLPLQAKLDEVVIKGTAETPAGDPDELYFDLYNQPSWNEQKITTGARDAYEWSDILYGRPLDVLCDQYSYVGPPLSVTVLPEPGAIALLAIGGLALMRRRR